MVPLLNSTQSFDFQHSTFDTPTQQKKSALRRSADFYILTLLTSSHR
jgi:hypothetical protein